MNECVCFGEDLAATHSYSFAVNIFPASRSHLGPVDKSERTLNPLSSDSH